MKHAPDARTPASASPSYAPRVAVFFCQWCIPDEREVTALLPADVAQSAVAIQVNCTARIEGEFVIKALAEGFDGVLVVGCELGECHYRTGNHRAVKRLGLLRNIFSMGGIYEQRLGAFWLSPHDPDSMRIQINDYVDGLREVGPFR
ncbi:MAG: hydrogenase iron-sulfur subunit [Candidatus Geothermincolia bacterium]